MYTSLWFRRPGGTPKLAVWLWVNGYTCKLYYPTLPLGVLWSPYPILHHHRNPHLPCFRLTDFMCIALTARPPLHHACYSSATNTYFYYFAVDAGIAGGLLLPILTLKNPCSQWQHLFQVDKQLWRINITVCTVLPMSVGKALCPTPLQPRCFGCTF